MHGCRFLSILTLIFANSVLADSINVADLVKVDAKLKQNCVEYFLYKDEQYCSTSPQLHTAPPTTIPERLKIQFDNRPWKLAWGKQTSSSAMLEYVPRGDNINDWHELVTSQFFPGLWKAGAPKLLADTVIKNIEATGFQPLVHFYENTPNRVIFEFQIKSPPPQRQDELQMVMRGNQGLYVLHYAIKKFDMGARRREEWIERLKNSSIKLSLPTVPAQAEQ